MGLEGRVLPPPVGLRQAQSRRDCRVVRPSLGRLLAMTDGRGGGGYGVRELAPAFRKRRRALRLRSLRQTQGRQDRPPHSRRAGGSPPSSSAKATEDERLRRTRGYGGLLAMTDGRGGGGYGVRELVRPGLDGRRRALRLRSGQAAALQKGLRPRPEEGVRQIASASRTRQSRVRTPPNDGSAAI